MRKRQSVGGARSVREQEISGLHDCVDFVHRYWQREIGSYPSGEDSAAIVLTIAALQELHALTCTAGVPQQRIA